jgi:hypothetical protein
VLLTYVRFRGTVIHCLRDLVTAGQSIHTTATNIQKSVIHLQHLDRKKYADRNKSKVADERQGGNERLLHK